MCADYVYRVTGKSKFTETNGSIEENHFIKEKNKGTNSLVLCTLSKIEKKCLCSMRLTHANSDCINDKFKDLKEKMEKCLQGELLISRNPFWILLNRR